MLKLIQPYNMLIHLLLQCEWCNKKAPIFYKRGLLGLCQKPIIHIVRGLLLQSSYVEQGSSFVPLHRVGQN